MSAENRSLQLRRWTISAIFGLMLLTYITSKPLMEPMDFRAFYCAGAALEQRANPYRLEPDRSCQARVLAESGLRFNRQFALPAPLPPYALTAFALLSRMPYRAAAEVWLLLSVLAVIVSVAYITELSGAPTALAGLALVASAGYAALVLGQVVPIVLAAALFAALRARRGDGWGSAAGAMLAAIEPHLALPIWLGLAFLPTARKPLLIAAVILGIVTLVPGIDLNVEYARAVIPLHARSELLNFGGQYSLSSLLVALGVPFQRALQAGTASYAFMLAAGLALGVALWRRHRNAAFLVLAPLASAVLGGPFIHITQTVVAIPLGFMLLTMLPRSTATFAGATLAITMLAIPWQLVGIGRTSTVVKRAAIVTQASLPRIVSPNESIEIPFTSYVDAFGRRAYPASSFYEVLERKLPTWVALIVILFGAAWSAYRAPRARVATINRV